MTEQAEKKLRVFIEKQTGRDLSSFSIDDDLFVELALDSLEALGLLAKIEKQFNIRIPNEELSDTRSLRSILNHL